MQIILLEKVVNLGDLGDVIKVKDGYARNYLIPTGRAKRATPATLADFESRRAELESAQAEKFAAAQIFGERLNGLTVTIIRKSGVDGRLFGSVTNYDVVDAIKEAGHIVDKSVIRMPDGPLKAVGDFPLEIRLGADVTASITVAVRSE